MADIRLKIDDFVFAGTEIPESIRFGGEQVLAKHRLIGGVRIIDTNGRDDVPLDWSGLFQGENALSRAQYLNALRVEGKQHTLTWDSLSFTVVIRSFYAEYRRRYWIPYRIEFEVVKDNATPPLSKPPVDIVKAIKEGIEEAETTANQLTDPPIPEDSVAAKKSPSAFDKIKAAVSDVKNRIGSAINNSTINSIKGFINDTNSTISSIKSDISDVQNMVQDEISSLTNQIQALTTLGGLVPGNSVSRNVLKYGEAATAFHNQYLLENLQYTLGRTEKNITAMDDTPNATTVIVSNTTLYAVAMSEYGDATLWDVIAKANGLTDPVVSGIVTLKIPPVSGVV